MAIFYALYFDFETSYVINSLNLFDFAFKVITTRSLENKLFIYNITWLITISRSVNSRRLSL